MTATIIDNQIGFAEETTYGSRVTPTRFLEFVSEGIARQENFRTSAGLRKGQKVQRSGNQSAINKGANGPLVMDLGLNGFSMILKHLFGKAPVIAGGPAFTHTFTLGDGVGLSLTTQIGKPGSITPIVVQPHDFQGCKITDGTITQAIDAYAQLQLGVDSQQDVTNQTLATASYPAAQELLHDGQLAITVNSVAFSPKSTSVKIDRNLNLARYFTRASTLKKEPLWQGLSPVTGNLEGEFEDWTTYGLFVGNTIVPIVFTWTGTTGSLVVTMPACRLEGPKPVTSKTGILDAPTPFTVLYDGTNEPITAVYTTTDAAI
jgi:hypothetical protein